MIWKENLTEKISLEENSKKSENLKVSIQKLDRMQQIGSKMYEILPKEPSPRTEIFANNKGFFQVLFSEKCEK